ncbi:MAG: T9SS type B sorting domain-containing protein [Flavobacterium sp.]
MKHILFFIILLSTAKLAAQNDCIDALVVCGDTNFNNIEVNGFGVQEVSSCGSQEFNSIWMKLNIATSGTLEFTITPQNTSIDEDFDFYLYEFVSCDDRNIIRCSTTNPRAAGLSSNLTGLNSTETDTSEGPGADGNGFLQSILVNAGETYMLAIDRASGNSNFSITWSGTATFNQPPQFQLPTGMATLDLSQCDTDGISDSSTAFDLTQNDPFIIGTQSNVAVTYHISESDALLGINEIGTPTAYANTSNPQTIYARIENTVTECFNTSEFEISILDDINLSATEFRICDDNLDGNEFNGQATFNMQNVTAEVFPNFSTPGLTIKYYLTQTDANSNNNALPQFFYNTVPFMQTVFIKIENATCSTTQPIDLIVRTFPAVTGANLLQCDFGATPDGFTLFNLSQADSFFTNNDPDFGVTYFKDMASVASNTMLPTNYTNTANPQNIIAKMTDISTGCSILYTLTLNVNTTPGQVFAALETCDIQRSGFASFDLSQANVILTPLQTAAYYPTLQDALLEQNPIGNSTNYTNTSPFGSSVFVRVDDAVNGCSGISEIVLQVNKLPEIEANDTAYICINQPGFQVTLDAGPLDSQPYTYVWHFNSTLLPDTTYSINATQTGTYTVDVINAKGCTNTRSILVSPSDIPTIASVVTEGSSIHGNSAIINLAPASSGTYGFSIDNPDGPFQLSNQFHSVSCGIHTAYVIDNNGCGVVSQSFEIIGIPVYFTPNGDGYEDFWNLRCAFTHPEIKIQVFDRYGKLLKQISASGGGWDGTYNGKALPADDYWYLIKFGDGKTNTGHFALKR